MKNRKEAEDYIYKLVEDILPGGGNKEMYETFFKSLNDEQFEQWIVSLEEDREYLRLVAPNLAKSKISLKRNLDLAKKMGRKFFHRLWLTDQQTGVTYLTPKEYLVIDLPLRRQIQTIKKKITVADDNKHIDDLTGQPTGESKGASISYPEAQILNAKQLYNVMSELMGARAGDSTKYNAMLKYIDRQGHVSLTMLNKLKTKTKATMSLSIILTAMHIANNLFSRDSSRLGIEDEK